jgi:hypothetical protein
MCYVAVAHVHKASHPTNSKAATGEEHAQEHAHRTEQALEKSILCADLGKPWPDLNSRDPSRISGVDLNSTDPSHQGGPRDSESRMDG